MKKISLIFFLTFPTLSFSNNIQVGFSPCGNSANLILNAINSAEKTIDIAAYSFTSKPISMALLRAKARGVAISVVADKKSNTQGYTAVNFLKNKNITVCLTDKYAIMHNKFMVIDGNTVQTGSFNYSKAAVESNAENVIVIKNSEIARTYKKEFNRLLAECQR